MILTYTALLFSKYFILIFLLSNLGKYPISKRHYFSWVTLSYTCYFLSYFDILFLTPASKHKYSLIIFTGVLSITLAFLAASLFLSYRYLWSYHSYFPSHHLMILTSLFEMILAINFGYFNLTFLGLGLVQISWLSPLIYYLTPFILPMIVSAIFLLIFEEDKKFYASFLAIMLILNGGLHLIGHPTTSNKNDVCIGLNTNIEKLGYKESFSIQKDALQKFTKKYTGVPIWLFPESFFSRPKYHKTLLMIDRKPGQFLFYNHTTSGKHRKNLLIGMDNLKNTIFLHQKQLMVPYHEEGVNVVDSFKKDIQKKSAAKIISGYLILPFICMEIFKLKWPDYKHTPKLTLYSANLSGVRSQQGKFICYLMARLQSAFHGSKLCEAINSGFIEH